ncbi:ATP-dependent DNA helicase [Clostridium tarantellae]|uniref:DNA 5'-3' helicase n=1 Tax=Clostridium tarantellae TaxID=39493 RepID=A0A6I1MN86_9CLOT|nr:ATP-dependent DNA helicase [Clostridium tarantellae]MPQ44430.1 DEAD/DEAH box helicase [Clostridium tarantellae]
MRKGIKVSIRSLIEFVMRHGSIDNRYSNSVKAIEGTRAHKKIQKSYKENYMAEFSLKYEFNYEGINIKVDGRADGILLEEENVVIDEIKTTTRDVLNIDEDFNPLHWAQGKCYGFIYAKDNNLDNIDIQLTYYNIETMAIKYLRKTYTYRELEEFFFGLIKEYSYWAKMEERWIEKRDASIKALEFPFKTYRKGQRELAIRVYKAIVEGKKCFAQAPTGIGKTISALFPTIKSMGEEYTSKIFYLTAKTITREVAEKSITLMKEKHLNIKSLTLTAKDKVCKMDDTNCNPDYCPYAKGYFDKINNCLKEILKEYDEFNRSTINELSEKYKLCPFELALDLTLWCDIIICDYNYVFDPKVALKRFFQDKKTDYTLLIDEAHNLVDRGRDMYSVKLSKENIMVLKRYFSKKDKLIHNSLNKINKYFISKKNLLEELQEYYLIENEEPLELYTMLRIFLQRVDEYLAQHKEENKELLDFYFNVHSFLNISEFYDENYITLVESDNKNVTIKLYCVNPSKLLIERMDKAKSTSIFSATLLPINYFKELYGYNEEDYLVNLSSPFNSNNRLILIGNKIDTTYHKRKETSKDIIKYIKAFIEAKKGNYMVFFPSYKYMELIYEKIKEEEFNLNIVMQENNMSEEDKEKFLLKYVEDNEESHIGFCVLGGHFSEGIDLIHDKLVGVIIVGVGMPQIGVERNIIKDYFDKKEGMGFQYAYLYAGMVKVLQAAGRCIRTEKDKGVIMFLDNRYSKSAYYNIFPKDYFPNVIMKQSNQVKEVCKTFWSIKKDGE